MAHGDAQRRGGELGDSTTRFDEQVADAIEDGATDVEASQVDVDSTTLVGVGTDVQAVLEELDDAAALAATAAGTAVTDSGAYYTAATVEAILAELGVIRAALFTNEVQTIVLSSWDDTDTIKFTYNAHETTAVTYAADVSAEIQAALIALADFEAGDLTVAYVDVNTYTVTFGGAFAGRNPSAITCTNGTGSATGAVTQTTIGGQVKVDALRLFGASVQAFGDDDVNIAHGNPVTVTGITATDIPFLIMKNAAGIDYTGVNCSDVASVGAGTVTFTATDFGATEGIFIAWINA